MYQNCLAILSVALLLCACGESEAPASDSVSSNLESAATEMQKNVADVVSETTAVVEEVATEAVEVAEESAESVTEASSEMLDAAAEKMDAMKEEAADMAEVAKEAATEEMAAIKQTAAAVMQDVESKVEDTVQDVSAAVASSDKPYQLVDGKISENAMNGWRTYNGGGCGACHGKGGVGAVGPNLANSVKNVLTQEQFIDVVTNGRSGTMMRPHKTNKRVMDNLDDLYVYLLARGDDVLGPGNLIKQPLGK